MRRRSRFAGAGRRRGAAVPTAWRPATGCGRSRGRGTGAGPPKYCGSSRAVPALSGMISIGPIAPAIVPSRWQVSTGPVPCSRIRASRNANPSPAIFSANALNVTPTGPVTSSSGTGTVSGPGPGSCWPGPKVRIWMRVQAATGSGSLPGGRNQMIRPVAARCSSQSFLASVAAWVIAACGCRLKTWTLTRWRRVLNTRIRTRPGS